MRCNICNSILEPKEIKFKDGKVEPCFECKYHIFDALDNLMTYDEHLQIWEKNVDDQKY